MQEDKHLKELLMKYAAESPSADFSNRVMRQISSAYAVKPGKTPFTRQHLPQVLPGMFIFICMLLFMLAVILPITTIPLQVNAQFSSRYIMQIFWFLIVFWIVFMLNEVYKRRAAKGW